MTLAETILQTIRAERAKCERQKQKEEIAYNCQVAYRRDTGKRSRTALKTKGRGGR